MHVKFMCTYSASSLSVQLCLVVSGLEETELKMTDKELKLSKRIFILEIKSFSMHSNIDPLNKRSRYIIFMRSLKIRNIQQTKRGTMGVTKIFCTSLLRESEK